jgi:hypothetical protein
MKKRREKTQGSINLNVLMWRRALVDLKVDVEEMTSDEAAFKAKLAPACRGEDGRIYEVRYLTWRKFGDS